MGRRYFTDTQYVAPAQAAATSQSQATQANAISQQQAERDQGLAKLNKQMQQPSRDVLPASNRITSEGVLPNQMPTRLNFNQDFNSFGFDLPLLSYLNKNRRDSDIDGGINYSYDPTTKTFMGNSRMGPVTKTLEEMQGLANNEINTIYRYADDLNPKRPQQPVQAAPIGEPEQAPMPTQPQQAPIPTQPEQAQGYNLLSYDDWSKTAQNPYYNKPYDKNSDYYSTIGQIRRYHNYLNNQEVPKDFASDAQRSSWINTKNNYNQYASNLSDEYQKNNPNPGVMFAQGGLMGLAKGRYLQGNTDGMADELRTSIEGKQPAALSHGEFVVPADVVSHLGNGNSDAGAKKLYQMMDRIRVARTGTKQQGKEINPDKFMPGGKVGYTQGGIAKFVEGGLASNVPSGTALAGGLTGSESSLSNWAGPYVTNMLGQGQALANQPYQAYTGQLTAGTSPLQQQAFQGAAGLSMPTNMGGFTPQSFTGQGIAQQYMNPYLQQALDPQLAEARRQSQITQTQNAGKLTGAGAYGGGRQAIMDAETQRNLATNLANITGQGYSTAYDKAMQQFNVEQQQAQQAQNLTNQYGLNVLGQQAGLGQAQRGIESEAVAADKAQFEEERLNPYKMVQFQQSLLSGLPLAAQTYNTAQPSWLQSLAQGSVFGANSLDAILKTLGLSSGQTGTQSAGKT
jgi:hypothetical protein